MAGIKELAKNDTQFCSVFLAATVATGVVGAIRLF